MREFKLNIIQEMSKFITIHHYLGYSRHEKFFSICENNAEH